MKDKNSIFISISLRAREDPGMFEVSSKLSRLVQFFGMHNLHKQTSPFRWGELSLRQSRMEVPRQVSAARSSLGFAARENCKDTGRARCGTIPYRDKEWCHHSASLEAHERGASDGQEFRSTRRL